MLERFNDKHIAILIALSNYKFLSYSQMLRLGIDKHKTNLSTSMNQLKSTRYPFVKSIPHRFGTEMKHYLTKKGATVLNEYYDTPIEEIKFPKGTIVQDTQDEKHRTSTIDCEIEINLHCEKEDATILMSDRYFDKVGDNRINKNLKSKTAFLFNKNNSVKADLITMIQTSSQKELFVLEIENGKDSKKALEKCENHAKAIMLGSLNEKLNFKQGYRTLWVFEYESIMIATIERLQNNRLLQKLQEYFLFKTLEGVKENIFDDWLNLARKKRKMYYNTFS